MNNRIFTLFIFSLLSLSNLALAQKTDVGNWLMYVGSQNINKKFNWHNEVQYRNYNFVGDLQQLIIRTGIGYNLTEGNNNILLGYGFINSQNYISDSDEKVGNNENRIFQQFITKQSFGRVVLQHRYRVEERFLQDDFELRFRYFLGFNIALNHKKMVPKTLYLSAYDEIFLNAESPIFDRNRLYGALGFVINKYFKVEAGFMSQMTEKSTRNQFQLTLFNNLPFRKEE